MAINDAVNIPGSTISNLLPRFGADVLSAAMTAFVVSPVVTLIDSTIMIKAVGNDSFTTCMKRFLMPYSSIPYKLFLSRPSRLVFAVYCGTYITANCMDTVSSALNGKPAATITASGTKFVTTSVVSTGLTVFKDSRLAQMFGKGGRSASVPLASYCLFTLRDAITIFACFNLPTVLAPKLAGMVESETRRLKYAQFILPASIQFITTPIHLFGLSLHNQRGTLGFKARAERVRRDMGTAIPARIVRIVPAFGVGGILNIGLRTSMMNNIEARAHI